jgi:hypothetical protein
MTLTSRLWAAALGAAVIAADLLAMVFLSSAVA